MKSRSAASHLRHRSFGFEVLESRHLMAAVELVSAAADGTPANGDTNYSGDGRYSMSADNRYVAFQSTATNLIATAVTTRQVYVKDLQTDGVRLASSSAAGVPAAEAADGALISENGRYVVFSSKAANLVAGDANDTYDVFRKDLSTGEIVRVNVDAGGIRLPDIATGPFDVSADDSRIVFTRVIPGNGSRTYVKYMDTGTLEEVGGGLIQDSTSFIAPAKISADGRYVVVSTNVQFASSDNDGKTDIYRYEIASKTAVRVTTPGILPPQSVLSPNYDISADGSVVSFGATEYFSEPTSGQRVFVVVNMNSGKAKRVSIPGVRGSEHALSNDGSFLAVDSNGSTLVPNDKNGTYDVFVIRLADDFISRVNLRPNNSEVPGGSLSPVFSPDGKYVLYESIADIGAGTIPQPSRNRLYVTNRSSGPITTLDTSLIYSANEAAKPVAPGLTITDADAAGPQKWEATIALTAGAEATDRLSIRNQGNGAGQLGVSGNNLSLGGKAIGTFAGGGGSTPLTVSITATISVTEMQSVLRNVTFFSSTASTNVGNRRVSFQTTDGDEGVGQSVTKSIVVRPAAFAPLLVLSGTVRTISGRTPIVLAPNAGLYYGGRASFAGGSITVSIAGGDAGDRLRFSSSARVTFSGTTVSVDTTAVGTLTGGDGTTPLTITLNANADAAKVEVLLRSINYANVAIDPAATNRVISFQFNNGAGRLSNIALKTVELIASPKVQLATDPILTSVNSVIQPFASASLTLDSRSSVSGGNLVVGFQSDFDFGAKLQLGSGYRFGYVSSTYVVFDPANKVIAYVTSGEKALSLRIVSGTVSTNEVVSLLKSVRFNTGNGPSRHELRVMFSDSNYGLSETARLQVTANRA